MGDLMIDNDDVPTSSQAFGIQSGPSPGCVCNSLIGGAFAIAQITMGAVFLDECPLSPFIPVYELVSGVVILVMVIPWGLPWVLKRGMLGQTCVAASLKLLIPAVVLFHFLWFIIGSYPMYSIYPPNYEKNLTAPEYNLTQSNYSHILSKLTDEPNLGVEKENETLSNLSQHSQNWTANYNQTGANRNQTLTLTNMNNKTLTGEGENRHQPNQTVGVLPYCDRTLYLFAFWTTTLVLISPLLVILCGCVNDMLCK